MFKHLLVPLDGGGLGERAVEAAIGLARQLGAAITGFVVEPPVATGGSGHGAWHHVEEMALHQQAAARHAERVLWRFEERADAAGVPFEGVYARARHVDAAIADAARQRGCDMIVMVTHGRGPFGELLFGACTKGVMARSPLPLLVLHPEPPAGRGHDAAAAAGRPGRSLGGH